MPTAPSYGSRTEPDVSGGLEEGAWMAIPRPSSRKTCLLVHSERRAAHGSRLSQPVLHDGRRPSQPFIALAREMQKAGGKLIVCALPPQAARNLRNRAASTPSFPVYGKPGRQPLRRSPDKPPRAAARMTEHLSATHHSGRISVLLALDDRARRGFTRLPRSTTRITPRPGRF